MRAASLRLGVGHSGTPGARPETRARSSVGCVSGLAIHVISYYAP
jgi:hypothetical protein